MSRYRIVSFLLTVVLASNVMHAVRGDEPLIGEEVNSEREDKSSSWYLPMKTLGGRQFWGDVRFFHDWRIQQNSFDGHYRLLDGQDFRYASGSLEECERRLQEIREERKLPPMSGKAVIFIHGIFRSSKCFDPMKERLREAGYEVFGFDYPSTRVEIPAAAQYLRQCIASLEGVTEINFVVHSMGGLVVRASLVDEPDPRFHRMVMLGVPNHGARMANLLQKNFLYRTLYGPAGQQLIGVAEGFIAQLPTPEFEFAVIAGARSTPNGYNPLIQGDDDGTVSLAETRLPGAHDFMTVRALHSLIMNEPTVIAATERFLRTGVLRESGLREPIAIEPSAADMLGIDSAAENPMPATP